MFSLLKKKRDEASGPNNPLPSSTMAAIAHAAPPHPPPADDAAAAPAETTSLATNSIASVLNPYPYSMPHATGGSLTSSPSSTCTKCGKTFYETPIDKFNHHVASCSHLDNDDDDDDDDDESETSSELSEMTRSPITPAHGHGADDKVDAFVPADPFSVYEPEPVSEHALQMNGASKKNVLVNFEYGTHNYAVRPYQNPQKLFDYYNEADGHQQVDVDVEDPDNSAKLRFPTLTKLDDFTEYLGNPEDMDEMTLFQRTSKVTEILQAYQVEFDAIDKQVVAHENTMKSDAEAVLILAKEQEATIKEAEEAEIKRKRLAAKNNNTSAAWHLDMAARKKGLEALKKKKTEYDWFLATAVGDPEVRELSRPDWEDEEKFRNSKPPLDYAPYPDYKPTKDEELDEKRRAGRLMPGWKFNDMKTADVYGFDYNPHVKYQGAQPLIPVVNKRRGANGIEVNDTGRLRAQRQPTRKFYEENSPETEGDSLPAKRARKPRNFEDMESTAVSRPASRNRDHSPKRFPSGKKIGRPSRAEALAKSNLSNSMIAASSQTPELSQDGSSQQARGAQELADDVQDDLASAAAGIVGSVPIKPKGKGGRPRKNAPKATAAKGKAKGKKAKGLDYVEDEDDAGFGAPKSNGRRRIKDEPVSQPTDMNGFLQSTEEDDQTRQSSEDYTSRPTTSSSNMTFSTEGSGRGRGRAKGNADQGNMSANRGSSAVGSASKRKRNGDDFIDPSNSGRGKRTKTAHRPFDPSSSIEGEGSHGTKRHKQDEDQELELPELSKPVPAGKKRKFASKIEEGDDQTDSEGKGKMSREESILALTGNPSLTPTTDPPAKKRRGTAKAKGEVPIEEWVQDPRSEDGRHLSLITDPGEREEVRKRRVKRGKSDKLSKSMRARWDDGRMNVAMETRKANAAKKKEEEKVTTTDPQPELQPQPEQPVFRAASAPKTVAPKPASATKSNSATKSVTSIKIKKSKGKAKDDLEEDAIYDESEEDEDTPAPPPVSTRRMSTRERKKPARVLTLDGTNEEDTELQRQFKSEYDRYQALTSPGTPIRLGKRVRKQINFAEPAGGSEEDEYF